MAIGYLLSFPAARAGLARRDKYRVSTDEIQRALGRLFAGA